MSESIIDPQQDAVFRTGCELVYGPFKKVNRDLGRISCNNCDFFKWVIEDYATGYESPEAIAGKQAATCTNRLPVAREGETYVSFPKGDGSYGLMVVVDFEAELGDDTSSEVVHASAE